MDNLEFRKQSSGSYTVLVNHKAILQITKCENNRYTVYHLDGGEYIYGDYGMYFYSDYAAMLRCIEYLRDCAEIGEVL